MEAASTLAGESSKRLSPDQKKVFQNALREYIAAMEYSGDFAFGRYNLAMLYNGRGENDKAERLFRDVVAKHPELYDVAYSLGLLLAERGKHKEALGYLERAAKGLPERSRIQYNLGLLLQVLQRDSEAEEALQK